jgi:hypothetical protein
MEVKSQIARLLNEADEAIDSETNGLMDREDFLILIHQLSGVIRDLLVERELTQPPDVDLPTKFDTLATQAMEDTSLSARA